ncbi:MAG: hypothetical protein WC994_08605 [Brumimicrobium sp.]
MKQANTYHIQNRNYRSSFQGQEHHDEIRGKGNYINYKYRGHDPRIGRLDWLIDPLAKKYPWNSPYAFSENRVLDGVELEGLEFLSSNEYLYYISNGKAYIAQSNWWWLENDNQRNNPGMGTGYGNELGAYAAGGPYFSFNTSGKPSPDMIGPYENPTNSSSYVPPGMRHTSMTRFSGIGLLAVNAVVQGFNAYYSSVNSNNADEVKRQIQNTFGDVIDVLNIGIGLGLIDEKYQNINDLSSLANVILFGKTSPWSKEEENKDLVDLGLQLYRTIVVPQPFVNNSDDNFQQANPRDNTAVKIYSEYYSILQEYQRYRNENKESDE